MSRLFFHFGKPFKLALHETASIKNGDLMITLKNASRLMVPRMGDQFLLTFEILDKGQTAVLSKDGTFRFPSNDIMIEWQNLSIQIRNMDWMAQWVELLILTNES